MSVDIGILSDEVANQVNPMGEALDKDSKGSCGRGTYEPDFFC
jgi:hypothetical protein